jgi:hypothetical protein
MGDETPAKLSEGLDRLLFGPVYLAGEIIGSVLPGLLFYLLLLHSQNSLATSLLRTEVIGYRAKIAVIIFVAYMVGKAFGLPYAILGPVIWER